MKKILINTLFLVLTAAVSYAQKAPIVEGTVTFLSTTNIYARFETTEGLVVNDTLMVFLNNQWTKALIVKVVSSKSCITNAIINEPILEGYRVGFYRKLTEKKPDTVAKLVKIEAKKDTISVIKSSETDKNAIRKQDINARFTLSSNGSMDEREKKYNRIRGSLVFDANNIKGGKLSFQSYINFRRGFGAGVTQGSFNDDFKIYALALTYDMNANTSLSFGRKINNRMANMGAIDGFQIEHKHKNIIYGGFFGSNPDYSDYGFNPKLLQLGAFVAYEKETTKGQSQTSFAFAEQKNDFKTDRRFVYFQHTNSIIKNVNLFYSLELDLFQNINGVKSNHINLTSTYISLRYRPFKKLNITTSYDNRRNVIYYETYRTYIDQLINQETRQGIRLQINHNMSKYLSMNVSGFYRYQESRPEPTKNYVVNITLSQFLGLGSSLSFNVNTMNTYYFDGNIIGARLNKDMFKGKMSAELNYRRVDYNFFNTEQQALQQNIMGVSANIYGKKRTAVMLSYEGTFEPNKSYNRYYITLSQRFRSKK